MSDISKIRTVVRQMLVDRGYRIESDDDEHIIGVDTSGDKICVFMNINLIINVGNCQSYTIQLDDMKIKRGILIYKDKITPSARKIIENSTERTLESFLYDRLKFNPTTHRLSSAHTKLDEKEAKKFLSVYNQNSLAVIKYNDPISRYYNFQIGNVIKIVRNNGYVTYRVVQE